MADDAVIRIVVQEDQSPGQPSAPRTSPVVTEPPPRPQFAPPVEPRIPPAAETVTGDATADTPIQRQPRRTPAPKQAFDPYQEAEKRKESEDRRKAVEAAYDDLYPKSAVDKFLDVAGQLRGTIGGAFGGIIGALLDVMAAYREAASQPTVPRPISTPEVPPVVQAPIPAPAAMPAPQPAVAEKLPQSQAIIDEARDALLAVGHSSKEADALLAQVMDNAKETFRSVADLLQAIYRRADERQPSAPQPPVPAAPNVPQPQQQRNVPTAAPVTPPSDTKEWWPSLPRPPMATPAPPANQPAPTRNAPAPSGGGAMAALPIAVAAATLQALGSLRDAASGAAKSLGQVESVGQSTKSLADSIFYVSPIVSAFGSVVGSAMEAIDARAQRYAEYSPVVAQAQALAEIRQVMGDLSRAQRAGPELARYLTVQAEMQQQFEETKIKILMQIMPTVISVMQILEQIMPSGDTVATAIKTALAPLTLLVDVMNGILNIQQDQNLPPPAEDPANVLLNNEVRTPWE